MACVDGKEIGEIIIHTGNLLNIKDVSMRVGQSATQELVQSIKHTISTCGAGFQADGAKGDTEMNMVADYHLLKLDVPEERKDVKVTVKLFFRKYEEAVIRRSLWHVMNSLRITMVETVILAVQCDSSLPFQTVQQAWTVLEDFVKQKTVLSIGVSGLGIYDFISLYEWAVVKPSVMQIDSAKCNKVPPVLREFADKHQILLLAHYDPKDILPDSDLSEAMAGMDNPLAESMLHRSFLWAARYQIRIKERAVLAAKGYIIGLMEGA